MKNQEFCAVLKIQTYLGGNMSSKKVNREKEWNLAKLENSFSTLTFQRHFFTKTSLHF
jgi:hypothetical protein